MSKLYQISERSLCFPATSPAVEHGGRKRYRLSGPLLSRVALWTGDIRADITGYHHDTSGEVVVHTESLYLSIPTDWIVHNVLVPRDDVIPAHKDRRDVERTIATPPSEATTDAGGRGRTTLARTP